SPVHMKWKLQKEPHQVLDMVIAQVTRARNHVEDVEWSAEDGTRTEFDFLCRCVEEAIKAGATTISAWRSPIRSPASRQARARSNAPSTASASAPAMRRWKKS